MEEELESELLRQQADNIKKRSLEIYLWFLFGMFFSGRAMFELILNGNPQYIIQNRYFEILLSLLVVIFPLLFRLIFNKLPLESIRSGRETNNIKIIHNHVGDNVVSSTSNGTNVAQLLAKKTTSESPEEFLSSLTLSSRALAKNMYSRSGVYLLIGVLIAFSGLAFFYLQTTSIANATDVTSLLVGLAPKFGILFFIEFVALFFLKQYKSSMDEFRYYESLQRSREETLAIVKLIKSTGKDIDVYELIEKCGFRSSSEKLENGQSTELLESKKLNKDETELLGKVLDLVGKRS